MHSCNKAQGGFYPGIRYPVYVRITETDDAIFECAIGQVKVYPQLRLEEAIQIVAKLNKEVDVQQGQHTNSEILRQREAGSCLLQFKTFLLHIQRIHSKLARLFHPNIG